MARFSQLSNFLISKKKVLILDCQIVEISIINIQMETIVWLLIKQYRDTCKELKKSNKSSLPMSFDVNLQNL